MQQRQLGPFQVSAIGLGCMNLSHAYGPPVSAEQGERVLLSALDAGVTLFDTAALYGFGANETLVGKVMKPHRQKFTLASKCGMQGVDVAGDGKLVRVIDGRPETIKKTCEDSLRRLQTDVIDLYYLHRWDKKVPIEDSVGALSDLVRKGHIRSIGLSEVSAATLRKAHATHPIAAVQTEYSLWTRNPEIAVLQACKDLGVAFVAFSPVARGFLCGAMDVSAFDAKDIRRSMPRDAGAARQGLRRAPGPQRHGAVSADRRGPPGRDGRLCRHRASAGRAELFDLAGGPRAALVAHQAQEPSVPGPLGPSRRVCAPGGERPAGRVPRAG